jgi:ABC-type Fe3+ transport system substrate-binding protein
MIAPMLARGGHMIGLCFVILALWLCPPAASAQSIQDVAAYSGAERQDKLVAGARKEGSVTIYTSLQIDDLKALNSVFEKKYGVKVNVWRGSAEDVRQRAIVEYRANRFDVDVFEVGGREMESLHREKLLQAVKSPVIEELVPQAVIGHGEWMGTRLNIILASYNTNLITKGDAPNRYEDLLEGRFKGKLGIEAEDEDWLATIVTGMGEEKGLKLFRDIVARNGISVRKGHTLLVNLVASGEVPLALTTYSYKARQLKAGGAPVELLGLNPSVARVNGVGVAPKAPHPHAAVLYFDFLLGVDGQKILQDLEFSPTNRRVAELPRDLQVQFSNSAQMLDEKEKWTKLYREIFSVRSR